ncbi:MAG: hypothetical protein AAFV07_08195 [Bacteroidota bacterium]
MNVLSWLQDPSVKFALLAVIAVHILLLITSGLIIKRHKEKIDARDIQLWKGLAFAVPIVGSVVFLFNFFRMKR